jgi:hypothetical protein
METSSESAEEQTPRNQRFSRLFFVTAGKIAGFESPESILDGGQ